VAGIARSNSVSTSTSYNSTSQNWSLATSGSSQDVTLGMAYTPAGQLTSRSISNSNYRYGIGSMATTTYCPNRLNQYATVDTSGGSCPGSTNMSYDDRGNLSNDGSRSFGYDLDNKLTCVGSSCAAMSLGYDPMGRLQTTTASSTEKYVYDGDTLVAEYDGSGNILRRYSAS
jgi:hypothetical protein